MERPYKFRRPEDGQILYNLYGQNDRTPEVLLGSNLTSAEAFRLKRNNYHFLTVREERIISRP